MTHAPALPASFLDQPLAHRALHDASCAENSMAAVKAAVAAGYGIEIDIQGSADGVPMVFHDYDLGRLTGQSGPIARRSAAELGEVALLGGGGTIPTLAQVLAQVNGAVPLLIEIKDQDGALGPNVGLLQEAVCEALDGYEGDVALMSFNPHAVAACQTHAPHLPRGLTTCPYPADDWPTVPERVRAVLREIPDFDRVGASFISHQQDDLTAAPVTALKSRGVPILCWTVRSAGVEAEARTVADNITFEGYRA
ncbi:MAG: glycerophosphodiester phosphodiesterase family protein [Pseudomonadota bacterium]